jgi:restriction system protein
MLPLELLLMKSSVLTPLVNVPFLSYLTIVVFVGDCEFKTDFPSNVLHSGLGSYITSFTKVIFSENEVRVLHGKLSDLKNNPPITNRQHISSLEDRFSSVSVCPRCGGKLVLRTAKVGANAGNQFYGCSKYPSCKFTKAN